MSQIRDVDSEGNVVEQQKPLEPNPKGTLEDPSDPLQLSVYQIMGVDGDMEKQKYSDKAGDILSWAKQMTEDHSPESIKWVIRDLEFKIGSPAVGEKMIDYLHSYVALMDQKQALDKKLKKYNPYGK